MAGVKRIIEKMKRQPNGIRPASQEDYSGKFIVRLPKSLHMRLAVEAEREGVSLNQYTLYKLAR